ncbi:Gp138 family membrane-puncturing spike protein [Paracandidimonas lactea]|uniref:Gp138 family membrane-puncturing spike protein n=1 Tax=Paracandidimonas lactea TaxID=2895524 RepID=UPI001F37E04A|nr:Gp138 family membrane-puncturing spike protein [Paracandidimonas lactea]
MNELIAAVLADLNVCLPGVIVAYDGTTATVRPAMPKQLANGETLAAPQIVQVPVCWPIADGGRAQITVPLKPGDPVRLTFSQRSLENWLSGSDQAPDDPRQFDLTDCFASPVMRPGVSADPDNVTVQYGAGTLKIAPSGDITIDAPSLTINAPTTVNGLLTYTQGMIGSGGTQTAQINGDVIANGVSLVHHKHPGDSGGTTGEPL